MNRKLKIGLYYLIMFFIMCTLIFIVEVKSDNEVKKSYEGTTYEGYEKYVSVPKNLEVLGRGDETTFIGVIGDTVTDKLLMVLFLIISTIPLVIYYSAKYIEKLDDETNELIDISNNEYLENKEKQKETINYTHKSLFEDGYFSSTSGMFAGMLSDHLKMKDVFISVKDEKNNAIVFEQDFKNTNYISKILKGFSYNGEGILVIDQNDFIFGNTCEIMNSYGYEILRLDFTDKENKNKILKNKKKSKIDLLKYFSSDNEIISLSNLISQGNSYLTKMIAALIFVITNDENLSMPSMKNVYDLSCESLEKIISKINLYKSSYNIFNELILLDNKAKNLLLEEARDSLEAFNNEMFDLNIIDKKTEIIDFEYIRKNSVICYINLDELKAPYPISNVIMEAMFNLCKNNYLKEGNKSNQNVYIINLALNMYSKYGHLSDRLKESKKYGIYYVLGLTNVKQFKDKYEYEYDKILEFSYLKIFYAIRQYETTQTLKDLLSNRGINDIANIIGALDTNKCLVLSKDYDYTVLNIDEPSGESYSKYSYGQKESESVIDKLKNKDVKLNVNYLDEFKERISKNKQDEKEKDKKISDEKIEVKPELTKEEREYIANLLKEKQEADEKKIIINSEKNEFEEDDELLDGDVDYKPEEKMVMSLTNLYDRFEKNEDDNEYDNDYSLQKQKDEFDIMLDNGYDSSKPICDERDKIKQAEKIKDSLSQNKSLRSKEDIDASLEKLNKMQSNIEKIIEEEKNKTTHALYEQMKNLK